MFNLLKMCIRDRYDKDNNLIEEWVSTDEPHIIRGLKINEEYRLHEDLAPLGYATASDITFTVEDDGKITQVIMKDEIIKIDISKVDATTGEEIEGAKLTLTDKETGEVIDSWTSAREPHLSLIHISSEMSQRCFYVFASPRLSSIYSIACIT